MDVFGIPRDSSPSNKDRLSRKDYEAFISGDDALFHTHRLSRQLGQKAWEHELDRQKAKYDELTGLPNRRALLEEMSDFDSENRGLIFIDVNRLKTINDTSGHSAGDDAIRQTADIIVDALRKSDVVRSFPSRYAGDEFVVLVDLTPREDSQQEDSGIQLSDGQRLAAIGERLKYAFAEQALNDPGFFGAAVGGHLWPLGTSGKEMIDKADAMMYVQKNANRQAGPSTD